MRRSYVSPAALLLLAFGAAGCASKRVLMPPRLDLRPHGTLGLVVFRAENAKGSLHELATRRFEEYVLAAQPGIEIRQFRTADSAQALGGERGVPVAFFGLLRVSDVKPRGNLSSVLSGRIEATITAELEVWLQSTRTGGTLWRSSARFTERVGGLSISGGVPEFSARDPEEAYGSLVNRLVHSVTWDMRGTWVRQ